MRGSELSLRDQEETKENDSMRKQLAEIYDALDEIIDKANLLRVPTALLGKENPERNVMPRRRTHSKRQLKILNGEKRRSISIV